MSLRVREVPGSTPGAARLFFIKSSRFVTICLALHSPGQPKIHDIHTYRDTVGHALRHSHFPLCSVATTRLTLLRCTASHCDPASLRIVLFETPQYLTCHRCAYEPSPIIYHAHICIYWTQQYTHCVSRLRLHQSLKRDVRDHSFDEQAETQSSNLLCFVSYHIV